MLLIFLGKKGKYEEAEIQFKQAISKDPTAPMIYTNLGTSRNAGEREYAKWTILFHRYQRTFETENSLRTRI